VVLIALLAVGLWGGLSLWSPTRRLGRLMRADQPAYIRREAVAALGHEIPSWEVDQAVRMLIGALDDPSPRVRENVGVGLFELGARAAPAIPRLVEVVGTDEDRLVRYSLARTLGMIITAGAPKSDAAVVALVRALDDVDPDVRLGAALSLLNIGETPRAAAVLVQACVDAAPERRQVALWAVRGAGAPHLFSGLLARSLRVRDPARRERAFQTLIELATPEAVRSALRAASDDPDPEVSAWASAQLEVLTEEP
jgi:HEAT repeat protein